jgi:hypothetical protein
MPLAIERQSPFASTPLRLRPIPFPWGFLRVCGISKKRVCQMAFSVRARLGAVGPRFPCFIIRLIDFVKIAKLLSRSWILMHAYINFSFAKQIKAIYTMKNENYLLMQQSFVLNVYFVYYLTYNSIAWRTAKCLLWRST